MSEGFPAQSFFTPGVGSVSFFTENEKKVSSSEVSSTITGPAASVLGGGGGDGGGSQGTPAVNGEDPVHWMGVTPGMENWGTTRSVQVPKPEGVAAQDSGTDSRSFDSGAWEDWRRSMDEMRSHSVSPVGEREKNRGREWGMREVGEKTKREEEEDQEVPLKKRKRVRYDLDDPSLPAYHKRRLLRQ